MEQVFNHAISGFIDAYVNDDNIYFVDGNSGAFYKYSINSNILTLNTLLYANNQCLRILPRRIINYENVYILYRIMDILFIKENLLMIR